MTERAAKKRRMVKRTLAVSTLAGLLAAAFTAGRSLAAGIPPSSALTYGGTLQSSSGSPLTGTHAIEVRFWTTSSGGATLCTSGEQEDVPLKLGRFSIVLPDSCTDAVKSNAEAYVEVVLDQVSLGRTKANAVPYAVEAAHAVLATDVQKSGALDQRLEALEAALATVVPAGTISAFGGEQAPSGWLLCDGTAVSRTTYAPLFAALATKWGAGDGSATFNLPDLRGRVPIGAGHASGLTDRAIGELLGEETHVLTVAEMPSHSHSVTSVPGWDALGGYSGGGWFGDPIPFDSSATGGNQPHNNMQPSAVVTYVIKY
jgi:microcystin-dependent protein